MTKSKKSTKKETIKPKLCPICNRPTLYVDRIHETAYDIIGDWYKCSCGVVFQSELPTHDVYNEFYIKNFSNAKESKIRGEHAARIYAPIIEETSYGRMLLDVGYNTGYTMDYFKDRGWLVWGIEINDSITGKGNIYKGNFETYDFSPNIDKTKLKEITGAKHEIKRTFDLIWMSHVLEHFNDPIAALKKAYNLLSETGLLYIAVPDIDFIYEMGTPRFPHWNKREHFIMWSERALVRELEKIGFNIIVKRRNYSSRFNQWNDCQIICQRIYF